MLQAHKGEGNEHAVTGTSTMASLDNPIFDGTMEEEAAGQCTTSVTPGAVRRSQTRCAVKSSVSKVPLRSSGTVWTAIMHQSAAATASSSGTQACSKTPARSSGKVLTSVDESAALPASSSGIQTCSTMGSDTSVTANTSGSANGVDAHTADNIVENTSPSVTGNSKIELTPRSTIGIRTLTAMKKPQTFSKTPTAVSAATGQGNAASCSTALTAHDSISPTRNCISKTWSY